jgi:hypothetical protein
MTHEALLLRIRKLRDHADSAAAIGNEHEAAAFAAKVSELLAQHRLTATDIDFSRYEQEDVQAEQVDTRDMGVGGARKSTPWVSQLASTLASHHGCRMYYTSGTSRITIVGKESDRAVATYLLSRLVADLDRLSRKSLKQYKAEYEYAPRYWRRSWLEGAVDGIRRQLRDARVKREQQYAGNTTALVRLATGTEAADAWINDNVRLRSATPRYANTHSGAYSSGRSHGASMNLNANGLGQSRSNGALR